MRYHSTRSSNASETYNFETVVLKGLAEDGGLYIPSKIPHITPEKWSLIKKIGTDFTKLAFELFRLFIDEEEISNDDLKELIGRSFSTFSHEKVTPLKASGTTNIEILELFHGPTFAFKDVALQFLGNLFEFFLKRINKNNPEAKKKITIVGATSGDTGSAAIYGLRNKENINVFILHPHGKVSPIQEAQMTQVLDDNVFNLSLNGTFDDCQDIVKALFADESFKKKYNLGAVNSINWARILAQITYYFHSYFSYIAKNPNITEVNYSVPTGNFGDILAGFYAKQLGLPINKLIIATNKNDILYRVIKTEEYNKVGHEVEPSLAPAMDILVSSNFERLLWYLARQGLNVDENQACLQVTNWMNTFKREGSVKFPKECIDLAKQTFISFRVEDEETLEIIRKYHSLPEPYLLDPHTAIGVFAAERAIEQGLTGPLICLATAHPGKFQDAIKQALNSKKQSSEDGIFDFDKAMYEGYLPSPFKSWMDDSKDKNVHLLSSNQTDEVKEFIISKAKFD